MEIKLNQWIYLENFNHGRLFAADADKIDNDHLVETDPTGKTGDKYQWMIHQVGSDYFIQNRSHGFMFSADGDKKGSDHLVECDPKVITLAQAISKGKDSSKWKWTLSASPTELLITNQRYGQMFAADEDKKGNDHLVETRPNGRDSGGKWAWAITEINPHIDWIYLENTLYGRLFAANEDKKGNDHLVEADPLCGSGDKYLWAIHQSGGECFIQNKLYGFMFAADQDRQGSDHLVECDPSVTTLLQAIKKGQENAKWKWDVGSGMGMVISNRRYGRMFAAAEDKKDNDHLVETRPNAQNTGGKWAWTRSEHWTPADWMGELATVIGNTPLKELVLPGTHDSGSYACSATSTLAPKQDIPEWVNAIYGIPLVGLGVMDVIARWAKAQGKNIAGQLAGGIRYLDLRVVRTGKQYDTCHSLYGASMNEVIHQTKTFLAQHPKELVILDFSHLYNMDSLNDQIPLIQQLIDAFGSKMAPNSMGPDNTLNDFWKKGYQVIALYDNADAVNQYPQLWSQSQISSPWPDTTHLDTLKRKMDDNLRQRNVNTLFVLQGLLTPDGDMIAKGLVPFTSDPSSLENLAKTVTPDVTTWLEDWASQNQNIAIVDWFNLANYVGTIRQINVQKHR
ncbi:hypothetical protein BXU06_02300 [Aquaspirillum sp. LM1]|uniref:hypothetical protein n=1 Tax=Aquaspirillum sp. LM1 TaxID=1938604 RepID=UPI000983C11C|nr:hypothetical protein [Aquaspirillum sp. LM1]AQR64020.1 hypothetical protein BXU06_02300 [Aquaspirillum sp. LM1]